MSADRVFDVLALAALAGLVLLGIGRGVMLSRRGVRLLGIDRERTVPQGLADLGFLLGFGLWVYEVIACALPLEAHLVPGWSRVSVLGSAGAKALGVVVLATGLAAYGLALRAFGGSWRLGIDRERPGALVTGGIFARSRNPIYLALTLLAVGSFLVLDRLVLGILAALFALYFRQLIRREEAFLREHYGEAYRDYARRVGRWWTWRPL